jgi:hypothetical protein
MKETVMAAASGLNQQISAQVKDLPEKEKREVLKFIEYLKIREDRLFLEYVNARSQAAVDAKKRGEHFSSLEELQQEYV